MSVDLTNFFHFCEDGQTAKVLHLIQNGLDVNIREYPSRNTGLHISAREGHIKLSSYLIEHGADVNALNENLQTPLMIALVDLGYFVKSEIIQLLIEKGASVNGRDKENVTPLYRSLTCCMEVRSMLLLNGATDDMYDWNALHYATKFLTTEKTILELVEKGISANSVCTIKHPLDPVFIKYSTPLHFMLSEIKHGQWDSTCCKIIQALLAKGAQINAENELAETPLLLACKANFSHSVINLLYEHGAKINESCASYPLLALACAKNNTELAKVHLQYHADINQPDHSGYTPLLWAVCNRNKDLVKFLLAAKCDINVKAKYFSDTSTYSNLEGSFIPAVNIALLEEQFEILEILIKNGALTTAVFNDGSNLLHHAVARRDVNLVNLLLEHMPKENINQQNANGHSPLHVACFKLQDVLEYFYTTHNESFDYENIEIFEQLVSAGGNVNIVDNFGYTPLLTAVEANYSVHVEMLLQKGAHTEVHTDSGWYPIHMAIWTLEPSILECLIKYGCNINARIECARFDDQFQNINALQLACQKLYYKAVKILLEKGVDIKDSKTGKSAMFDIIGYKGEIERSQLFQLLHSYGAQIDCTDTNGDTLLHSACQHNQFDLCNEIIAAGADIHAINQNGENVLHSALKLKSVRSSEDLCNYPTYLPWKLPQMDGVDQRECNWRNAEVNSVKGEVGIKRLLDLGVDINHKDNNGNLPLHTYLKHSHISQCLLKLLCEAGSLLNEQNSEGKRPLDTALNNDIIKAMDKADLSLQLCRLECLLNNNADYEYLNNSGTRMPLLHWAILYKPLCVVYKLLSSGCNVNVTSNHTDKMLLFTGPYEGRNALEYATNYIIARYNLVPALLLSGCSVHGKNLIPNISLNNVIKRTTATDFGYMEDDRLARLQAFVCLLSAGARVVENSKKPFHKILRRYHPKKMIYRSLLHNKPYVGEISDAVDIMLQCGIIPNVDRLTMRSREDDVKKIIVKIKEHVKQPKQVPRLDRQAANLIRTLLRPNAWASVDKLEITCISKELITFGKNEIINKYYRNDAWLTAFRKLLQSRDVSEMTYKDADVYYNDAIDDEDYVPERPILSPQYSSASSSPGYGGYSPTSSCSSLSSAFASPLYNPDSPITISSSSDSDCETPDWAAMMVEWLTH